MQDKEKQFRSRLQREQYASAPIRGVGAAYAENQRRAGIANPEMAAEEATKSDATRIANAEMLEKEEEKRQELIEDILGCIVGGAKINDPLFQLNGGNSTMSHEQIEDVLNKATLEKLNEWQKEASKQLEERIEAEDEEILESMMGGVNQMDPSDPLYNPMMDKERRRRIESGLEEIDFAEMVFKGSATQDVPLRDGFMVTFSTLPTLHGLWLEWYMSKQEETSYQHTRHLFSLIQLAASLEKLNGRPVEPSLAVYTKSDTTSRDGFVTALEKRLEFLGRMPSVLTDDLIIHYVWFNGRVRKLLAGDTMRKVGNY